MAKKQQSFFQKRSVVATFGIIGLLAGFFFLNEKPIGKATGNFVVSSYQAFSLISIIGLFLILGSAILVIYSIVKKP